MIEEDPIGVLLKDATYWLRVAILAAAGVFVVISLSVIMAHLRWGM